MTFIATIIIVILISAILALVFKRRSLRKNKPFSNEVQQTDQLLKIIQINYKGAITHLKEKVSAMNKDNQHYNSLILRNTMPTFMFEASNHEAMHQYDIPEEIRLALQRLRIFIGENASVTLRILKEAETIQYDNNEIIFGKDQVVNHVYLVIYGTVKIQAKLFGQHETEVTLSTGDCIFSFMNIIENITGSEVPSSATAFADGECGVVKIPIEFFYTAGTKIKLLETAIAWSERFKHRVLVSNLSLTEYIAQRNFHNLCNCQNCDNIDFLINNSRQQLKDFLKFDDDIYEDIIVNAEIFVFNIHEPIHDSHDSLIFLCHGSIDETVSTEGVPGRSVYAHHNANTFIGITNMFIIKPNEYKLNVTGKNTTVFKWKNSEHLRLAHKYPEWLNVILREYLNQHSEFYRAVEWLSLQLEYPRDSTILHSDGVPKGLYTIISGRVRAIELNKGDAEPIIVEELGQGDTIGLNEAVCHVPNQTSYITVRFTSVIVIPMTLFKSLKALIPSSTTLLSPLYARSARRMSQLITNEKMKNQGILSNVKTLAVVPGTSNVSHSKFSRYLFSCLEKYSPKCIMINNDHICRQFNTTDVNNISSFRLISYLSYLESEYSLVLMICNDTMTKWSIHALEQADVILTVLNFAEADKEPQGIEKKIMEMKFKTTREVIFLHPYATEFISETGKRLNLRKGYHQHFHIRCSEPFFTTNEESIEKFDVSNHFSRLARFLTGKAFGLALGGGGAKGIAHLGAIRSMLERNIPIDFVSGTSIGAFAGGLWALHENIDRVESEFKEFSDAAGSWLYWLLDLTPPFVSLFSGTQFSYRLNRAFSTQNIEDFWTPFMCITTDLTLERKRVHDSGPAAAYIQASMTIIGYLPPVSDPSDNNLLVDGGYTDLNPVMDLSSRGCKNIVGIVVSSDNIGMYKGNHGRSLSGLWAMFSRINPFCAYKSPSFLELQYHLGFICASNVMQSLDQSPTGIGFIRPDLQKFTNTSFKHFKKIHRIGKASCDAHFDSVACIQCSTGIVGCTKCHNVSAESCSIRV